MGALISISNGVVSLSLPQKPHLGYEPHKEEFCHRRGVYFHKHRCTVGMACAQAVAIRSAPYVARRHADVPRDLPLRMAMNEWDRDEVSELVRA